MTKSSFTVHKLKYLGYRITKDGIQPIASKVEANKKMSTQNQKAFGVFSGMINYYRDIWVWHSENLVPLTSLTFKKD